MSFSVLRKAAVVTLFAIGLLLLSNVAAQAAPAAALAQVQKTTFVAAEGGPAGWLGAIWQWITATTSPEPPPDGGGGTAGPNGGGDGGTDGGGTGAGPGIDPDGSKDP
jgi:hypothetical protein